MSAGRIIATLGLFSMTCLLFWGIFIIPTLFAVYFGGIYWWLGVLISICLLPIAILLAFLMFILVTYKGV